MTRFEGPPLRFPRLPVDDELEIRSLFARYGHLADAGDPLFVELFTPDVAYLVSPWRPPIEGLAAVGDFWEAGRDGPDEAFTFTSEIVAVDGDTAVVRAEVEYTGPDTSRWRDLWAAGQGVGAIKAVEPVATVVAQLRDEYEQAARRFAGRVQENDDAR